MNGVGKTPHKTREQHEKAAKLIAEGSPIDKALVTAGWSPKQAKKGTSALPKAVINSLLKQGVKLHELGRQVLADPKRAEAILVGRLAMNAITGEDKAVQSAKTLGSHRSINCFTPDNQLGIQVNIGALADLEDDSLIRTSVTITSVNVTPPGKT